MQENTRLLIESSGIIAADRRLHVGAVVHTLDQDRTWESLAGCEEVVVKCTFKRFEKSVLKWSKSFTVLLTTERTNEMQSMHSNCRYALKDMQKNESVAAWTCGGAKEEGEPFLQRALAEYEVVGNPDRKRNKVPLTPQKIHGQVSAYYNRHLRAAPVHFARIVRFMCLESPGFCIDEAFCVPSAY